MYWLFNQNFFLRYFMISFILLWYYIDGHLKFDSMYIKITCIFISVQFYLFAYFLSYFSPIPISITFISWCFYNLVFFNGHLEIVFLTAISIVHFPVTWLEDLQCCRLEYIIFSPCVLVLFFNPNLGSSICCTLSYVWLCDPIDYSTPGFSVLHYLPEFTQTHVHWVNDTMQPFHPLLPSSPLSVFPSIRVFSNESALVSSITYLVFLPGLS